MDIIFKLTNYVTFDIYKNESNPQVLVETTGFSSLYLF